MSELSTITTLSDAELDAVTGGIATGGNSGAATGGAGGENTNGDTIQLNFSDD